VLAKQSIKHIADSVQNDLGAIGDLTGFAVLGDDIALQIGASGAEVRGAEMGNQHLASVTPET
jgi:hypothetical protein